MHKSHHYHSYCACSSKENSWSIETLEKEKHFKFEFKLELLNGSRIFKKKKKKYVYQIFWMIFHILIENHIWMSNTSDSYTFSYSHLGLTRGQVCDRVLRKYKIFLIYSIFTVHNGTSENMSNNNSKFKNFDSRDDNYIMDENKWFIFWMENG